MDIKDLAVKLLMDKVGSVKDSSVVESALGDLLAGGSKFDLTGLVEKFTGSGGGIAVTAKTWLGDGANNSISANQVQETLGVDKIEAFAAQLGIDPGEASAGLSEMLPQLVDKASSGGNLLSAIGGNNALSGIVSKLF